MGNRKIKYNIITKGALSSGSSAVRDLLIEYDTINVIPEEFEDFRIPGLVSDQLAKETVVDYPNKIDDFVRRKSSRFSMLFYLLPATLWRKGFNLRWLNRINLKLIELNQIYSKSKVISKIIRRIHYSTTTFSNKIIRFNQIFYLKELNNVLKSGISFEEKIKHSNEWIHKISCINSSEKEFAVFDQPLLPSAENEIWRSVFSPYKLICVFRDPKDQLAEMVKRGILFSPFSSAEMTYTGDNLMALYGKDRKGMMKFLVDALHKRLQYFDKLEKELGPDEFLLIDFEGLVNRYDEYKSLIENFLGISSQDHKYKKVYFNPDISKENIGIYHKYLISTDIDLISELDTWYQGKISQQGRA